MDEGLRLYYIQMPLKQVGLNLKKQLEKKTN